MFPILLLLNSDKLRMELELKSLTPVAALPCKMSVYIIENDLFNVRRRLFDKELLLAYFFLQDVPLTQKLLPVRYQ